jgi:Flp pilus assembly pilin Flp
MLPRFTRRAMSFVQDEGGPTAAEVAAVLALIIVACITAITIYRAYIHG